MYAIRSYYDISYFLPADLKCSSCGSKSLIKENDILDVWFDSGVSHAAVLESREDLRWPADLYLDRITSYNVCYTKLLRDPRPFAQGSLKETFTVYPHIGNVIPAMGYTPEQINDLEKTIDKTDCDLVVFATPIHLPVITSYSIHYTKLYECPAS